MDQNELLRYLDITDRVVHCYLNDVPSEYYKLNYQNEFFKKIWKDTGMLKPIEYLDLEKHPTALIAYLLVLNFCYNQNETIINDLDKPLIWNSSDCLILDNNCINQLNMISYDNAKYSSIFNLINQTSTSMGRRLLKEMLLTPSLDKDQLNERYSYIDVLSKPIEMPETNNKVKKLSGVSLQFYLYQKFEPHLNQIADIERFYRKICLGLLQPSEFSQLHSSYEQVAQIIKLIESSGIQIYWI